MQYSFGKLNNRSALCKCKQRLLLNMQRALRAFKNTKHSFNPTILFENWNAHAAKNFRCTHDKSRCRKMVWRCHDDDDNDGYDEKKLLMYWQFTIYNWNWRTLVCQCANWILLSFITVWSPPHHIYKIGCTWQSPIIHKQKLNRKFASPVFFPLPLGASPLVSLLGLFRIHKMHSVLSK